MPFHPRRLLLAVALAATVFAIAAPAGFARNDPQPALKAKPTLGQRAAKVALRAVGVSYRWMKPGDLLFFSGLGHVGIYLGRGRMVHAPHSGSLVQVVSLGQSGYGGRLVGARRIAPS